MSITVPSKKAGQTHDRIKCGISVSSACPDPGIFAKGGGGGEGGPCPPDRKKLLCLKKNADSFTEGVQFFTSHQQSFSYVGTGLPELNQY